MVAYDFRCAQHGPFELHMSMAEATPTANCPECGRVAGRIYAAPMTRRAPAHLVAAIDAAEKSRHEPEVVTSIPRRPPHKRTPMAPPNPAFNKLPRP